MPMFRFVIFEDTEQDPPAERALRNAEDARKEAIAALTEMAFDAPTDGVDRTFSAAVVDADGSAVYKAKLTVQSRWTSQSEPRGETAE